MGNRTARMRAVIESVFEDRGTTNAKRAFKGATEETEKWTLAAGVAEEDTRRLEDKQTELARAVARGEKSFEDAERELNEYAGSLEEAGVGTHKFSTTVRDLTIGFAAAGLAAKQTWEAIGEGAALNTARTQFDNLTTSIGSTATVMLADMQQATAGMVSNADMISSANELMSLKLATSRDEVVRMATVVGKLGVDMQQLGMTIANESTLRLDALGLAIADVVPRWNELKDAGVASQEAFKTAVIEAMEEKVELLGDTSDQTEGDIRRVEAAVNDMNNAFKMELAIQMAGALDMLGDSSQSSARSMEALGGGVARGLGGTLNTYLRFFPPARLAIARMNAENEEWFQITSKTIGAVKNASKAVEEFEPEVRDLSRAEEMHAHWQTKVNEASEWWGALAKDMAANTEEYARGERQLNVELADTVNWQERSAKVLPGVRAEQEKMRDIAVSYVTPSRVVADNLGRFAMAALEGETPTGNFAQRLLEVAGAGISSAGALGGLLKATGDFTEAEITAAIKAATMEATIRELGEEIATGTTTVEDAFLELEKLEFQLGKDYEATIGVDDSELLRKMAAANAALDNYAQRSVSATVTINTNEPPLGSQTGDAPSSTGPPPGTKPKNFDPVKDNAPNSASVINFNVDGDTLATVAINKLGDLG